MSARDIDDAVLLAVGAHYKTNDRKRLVGPRHSSVSAVLSDSGRDVHFVGRGRRG